jgi:hypothetical protein
MTGSNLPEGPDWWQASDGKWYPPELRSSSPTSVSTASPSPMPSGPGATGAPTSVAPNYTPGIGTYQVAANSQPGFFARLFDLSFSDYITPSIIKLLYVLGIVVSSLMGLAVLVAGINAGSSLGTFIGIFLGPGGALIGIIYIRVLLELIMVFFRIEKNTR